MSYFKKSSKKSIAIILCLLTLLTSLSTGAFAAANVDEALLYSDRVVTSEKEYRVTNGVTERLFVLNNAAKNNQIKNYVMEVDLSNPDLSIVAGYTNADASKWAMSTVPEQASAMEKKTGLNVIGAFNGDHYNTSTGEPAGMLIMGGIVYHSGAEPFFAILNDGTAVIRSAGGRTDDVKEAVSGSYILVKNGKAIYNSPSWNLSVHPRTAVGIKADGTVVFMVSDGRQQPDSCGMNIDELADTMAAIGCDTALAFDGGGSSTFMSERECISDFSIRNYPCYGFERPVASSIIVCSAAQPTGEFDHITFAETDLIVHPNHSVKIEAVACDINGFKAELSGGQLVVEDSSYGTLSGATFRAKNKEGTVNINYVVDGEVIATTTIEVTYDADNFIEQFIKAISQAFSNMINMIKFIFEKLSGQ